jgi:hypothetical protein
MIFSDIIGVLEALATLIGLPFFAVLVGFFFLAAELFVLGVIILIAVWRIRKEMINFNRKIDLLVEQPEKEPGKEPVNESQKESEKDLVKEPEKLPDNDFKKKKYRYKWK